MIMPINPIPQPIGELLAERLHQPVKQPIPKDRLQRRFNGICHRLSRIEGLTLEPWHVFYRVIGAAAHLGIASENPAWIRPKQAIILFGPVGCGKTTLFRRAFANNFDVPIISAAKVMTDFEDYPDSFAADRRNWSTTDLILDDLAAERRTVKRFGSTFGLAEWLNWRYDCYQRHGALTYITTNAHNRRELDDLYGERVVSRLKEMCAPLVYDHADRRAGSPSPATQKD